MSKKSIFISFVAGTDQLVVVFLSFLEVEKIKLEGT